MRFSGFIVTVVSVFISVSCQKRPTPQAEDRFRIAEDLYPKTKTSSNHKHNKEQRSYASIVADVEKCQSATVLADSKKLGEYTKAPEPGHSHFGGAFDEGPRRQTTLWIDSPKTAFLKSSCTAEADAYLQQGWQQLHGFLHYEAERSFRTALAIDAKCAAAKISMVLSQALWIGNHSRAVDFLSRILKDPDLPTWSEHHQDYVAALVFLYNKDNQSNEIAEVCFAANLKKLTETHATDYEAKALLGVWLWDHGLGALLTPESDDYLLSVKAIDALFNEVLAHEGEHPVHHYRVHLYDEVGLAQEALDSADTVGFSGPWIAHMWHMAGHIYQKTEDLFELWLTQEKSAQTDHMYMDRDAVLPYQLHNHAHNQEWLVRTLISLEQFDAAEESALNLIRIPRHPKYNSGDDFSSHFNVGLRRLWGAYLLSGQDDKIVESLDAHLKYILKADSTSMNTLLTFAIFSAHRAQKGKSFFEKYADLLSEKQRKNPAKIYKCLVDPCDAEVLLELLVDELSGSDLVVSLVHLLNLSLDKKNLSAARLYVKALSYIDAYSHLFLPQSRALLRYHREMNHLRKVNQLEKKIAKFSNRDAYSAWRSDYESVLKGLSSHASYRIWRPRKVAPASLQMEDINLNTLSAEQQTRPVLYVFSLSEGCAFCSEQTRIVYEKSLQFIKDVDVVIVSLDTVDSLKVLDESRKKQYGLDKNLDYLAHPIRLVSDPQAEIFKKFLAFDTFESLPLHGLFLIDTDKRVLWEDISYQAFLEIDFLLEEVSRMVKEQTWAD